MKNGNPPHDKQIMKP